MGKADRISGIFWLCFSILIIIQSYRLGLGTLHHPGPGFLFFWVNIILGIMSVIVLVRAWVRKATEVPQPAIFHGQNLFKVVLVLLSLFLYVIFMETVGFIPLTALLFIFLLGIIEKKRWFFTVFVSVVVTAISYLIFEVWLQCMLPRGLMNVLRF
jgi:putative tricarboxylic transport membrane protein